MTDGPALPDLATIQVYRNRQGSLRFRLEASGRKNEVLDGVQMLDRVAQMIGEDRLRARLRSAARRRDRR